MASTLVAMVSNLLAIAAENRPAFHHLLGCQHRQLLPLRLGDRNLPVDPMAWGQHSHVLPCLSPGAPVLDTWLPGPTISPTRACATRVFEHVGA